MESETQSNSNKLECLWQVSILNQAWYIMDTVPKVAPLREALALLKTLVKGLANHKRSSLLIERVA